MRRIQVGEQECLHQRRGNTRAQARRVTNLRSPEPTFAERARTLVYLGRVGSLSTLSRKQQGFPFGSVMPYGLDDHGNPVFLISTMAMHTQNVQADPRSSLLVTQPDAGGDPSGGVQGHVARKCSAGT